MPSRFTFERGADPGGKEQLAYRALNRQEMGCAGCFFAVAGPTSCQFAVTVSDFA